MLYFLLTLVSFWLPLPKDAYRVQVDFINSEMEQQPSVLEIYKENALISRYQSQGNLKFEMPSGDYTFKIISCYTVEVEVEIEKRNHHIVMVLDECEPQKNLNELYVSRKSY